MNEQRHFPRVLRRRRSSESQKRERGMELDRHGRDTHQETSFPMPCSLFPLLPQRLWAPPQPGSHYRHAGDRYRRHPPTVRSDRQHDDQQHHSGKQHGQRRRPFGSSRYRAVRLPITDHRTKALVCQQIPVQALRTARRGEGGDQNEHRRGHDGQENTDDTRRETAVRQHQPGPAVPGRSAFPGLLRRWGAGPVFHPDVLPHSRWQRKPRCME